MEFIFKKGSGFKLKIGPTGLSTLLVVLDMFFGTGAAIKVPQYAFDALMTVAVR